MEPRGGGVSSPPDRICFAEEAADKRSIWRFAYSIWACWDCAKDLRIDDDDTYLEPRDPMSEV